MRPSHILTSLVALSGLSSAWPWPPSLDDLKSLSGLDSVLDRRQNGNSDNSNNNAQASPQSSPAPTAKATLSDSNGGNSKSQSSGEKSNGPTKSGDKATTSLKSVPSNAFPGGVNLIQPNTQFGGSQYYGFSAGVPSTVTWVWNYTSLYRTPAAIDVVATMASTSGGINPSPYTLRSNLSFDATQTFKWDTGAYAETSQMAVGVYTLLVYDAGVDGGATGVPPTGGLAPYNQFYFGMYTPAQYTAIASPSLVCATCNAAGGKMERLTWRVLTGVVGLTVATSVWFTGAAGVW